MILLCFKSSQYIWEKTTYHPTKMALEWEAEGVVMKQLFTAWPGEKDYTVFRKVTDEVHLDQIKFYKKMYSARNGYKIDIKRELTALKSNEKVLICQNNWLDSIQHIFQIEILFESEQGKLILLK